MYVCMGKTLYFSKLYLAKLYFPTFSTVYSNSISQLSIQRVFLKHTSEQEVVGCPLLTLITHLLLAINSSVNFLVYYLGRLIKSP